MKNIFVSFIVPVYNVENFLAQCIESILAQTVSNFELILIDDGSTDSSGTICDNYADSDPRIHVIHQQNQGVCAARNAGLDIAKGDYYVLCDGDDVVSPILIEQCASAMELNSLDCFIYGYKCVPADFNNLVVEKCDNIELMDAYTALKTSLVGEKFRMLSCDKMYASYLWNGIRFPVGRTYGDDTSVTYHLLSNASKIGYSSTPLYYYRMHASSALHRPLSFSHFQLFDAYDELIQYVKENHKQLSSLAYYAYSVRIFDFLARLKNEQDFTTSYAYLKRLKHYIQKHIGGFLCTSYVPKTQKVLLVILAFFSSRFFIKIFSYM